MKTVTINGKPKDESLTEQNRSMRLPSSICLLVFCFFCQAKGPQYQQVLPVDQSTADSGFTATKQSISKAIEKRDSNLIASLLAHDVQSSFGVDGRGIAEFKRQWNVGNPTSPFWDALKQMLMYGCTDENENGKRIFACPYTYSRLPESSDPSSQIVLYRKNIPIYEEPDTLSKVLSRVDYAALLVQSWKPAGWIKVSGFLGEKAGFIIDKEVYTFADPRITFAREGDKWKISTMIAGD